MGLVVICGYPKGRLIEVRIIEVALYTGYKIYLLLGDVRLKKSWGGQRWAR